VSVGCESQAADLVAMSVGCESQAADLSGLCPWAVRARQRIVSVGCVNHAADVWVTAACCPAYCRVCQECWRRCADLLLTATPVACG